MKMKMFTAPTEKEALALVRSELGPDAVILSTATREEDGIVEVRAAVERAFNNLATPKFAEAKPKFDETRSRLSTSLRWHGAPDGFVQLAADAGGRLGAGLDPQGALSAGLEGLLTFNPLNSRPEKSILLVGPPGCGKTTTAAKLAFELSETDSPIEAVAADFDASGQTARLAALTLKVSVTNALTPDGLVRLVAERDDKGQRIVIDGPPFNPLDSGDMSRLTALISRINIEAILVLAADGNPMEMEDNARAFGLAGCRRVILTRLDAVRRRGGAIAAISSSRLSIAQLGMGPSVRGGLVPATSERVASLLLAEAQAEAELFKGAA
ncbi:MAG: AAA family ATPase [Alphaproteobacteria bacterium]|nr:AAA family ATPase [Alphaproteobacteria bacterium]